MPALVLVVCIYSITFLLLLISFILFYDWRSISVTRKCRALPAVPDQHFIFGLGLEMLKWKPEEFIDNLKRIWKTVGDVIYFEKLGAPNVFIIDPNDIEILTNSKENITKGKVYSFMTPWQGEGLATSTGTKWFKRRKMLTPTFHLDILKNFIPTFNEDARMLTQKIMQEAPNSEPINIDFYLHACTLDIILKTAMGLNLTSYEGKAAEYGDQVERINAFILERFSTFWMHHDWLFYFSSTGKKFDQTVKEMHAFSDRVIKDRKRTIKLQDYTSLVANAGGIGHTKQRLCFLDFLIRAQIKDPELMTDEGIREEVDTFMAGGDYVIFLSLKLILFMIAIHPHVQDKVREELTEIYGDDDRDATLEDLKLMNYLDMVIKETLRLYPIIPVFNRGLTTDLHLSNYTIPAGTTVWVSPYLTHRRPDAFPDPEKFEPDRFSPEASKDRHPFAYIPFSAGYRNCIAQRFSMLELKVILSTLLRKLEVGSPLAREELKIIIGRNLKILPEIRFSFKPIDLH